MGFEHLINLYVYQQIRSAFTKQLPCVCTVGLAHNVNTFFVIGLSYGNDRYSTHFLIDSAIVNIWTLFNVLLRFYINTACCFDIG